MHLFNYLFDQERILVNDNQYYRSCTVLVCLRFLFLRFLHVVQCVQLGQLAFFISMVEVIYSHSLGQNDPLQELMTMMYLILVLCHQVGKHRVIAWIVAQ